MVTYIQLFYFKPDRADAYIPIAEVLVPVEADKLKQQLRHTCLEGKKHKFADIGTKDELVFVVNTATEFLYDTTTFFGKAKLMLRNRTEVADKEEEN